MTVFQTLTLMISFDVLVYQTEKRNDPLHMPFAVALIEVEGVCPSAAAFLLFWP